MSKIINGLLINRVPMKKHFNKDEYTSEYNNIISEYEFLYLEDDCPYYPSACVEIKFNKKKGGGKDKKQIYTFSGPSAIGKSFIANSLFNKIRCII